MNEISKPKAIIIYIIIVFCGILTIRYQLYFENFWLDEMTSFWVADPTISLEETFFRHKKSDFHNPILFNLILKKFLYLTKYEPNTARLLPFFFGIISLFFFGLLSYQIKKDNSFLLTTFFACVSIYIIKYSQEVRPYSLLLMLSIINIFLYCQIFRKVNSNKLYSYSITFIFIIVSVLNYSTNPFSLIILYSQIAHLIFVFFYLKKKKIFINVSLIIIVFLYLLLNYNYINHQISFSSFMLSSDISNVMDGLYFPRFFGSKIMGYIYLICLFFLFFYMRNIILINNNYLFLVIILLFSYLIPFIYGLVRTPVLLDRYIIFVLIPIILLISCLSNEVKSKKIKNFVIYFLIISTLFNHYLEIFKRENKKPEFVKMLEYIKINSLEKNIIIYDLYPNSSQVFNYLNNIDSELTKNLNLIQFDKNIPKNLNNFWLLCYKPDKSIYCDIQDSTNWNLQEVKTKYLVEAKLFNLK